MSMGENTELVLIQVDAGKCDLCGVRETSNWCTSCMPQHYVCSGCLESHKAQKVRLTDA